VEVCHLLGHSTEDIWAGVALLDHSILVAVLDNAAVPEPHRQLLALGAPADTGGSHARLAGHQPHILPHLQHIQPTRGESHGHQLWAARVPLEPTHPSPWGDRAGVELGATLQNASSGEFWAWTTALVSKKLRERVPATLHARQRVRESEERERWRGGAGVGTWVAFRQDPSTWLLREPLADLSTSSSTAVSKTHTPELVARKVSPCREEDTSRDTRASPGMAGSPISTLRNCLK
jgi:hypothetical protein